MKKVVKIKKRNPIATNLKVNKPKVYKDKTKYDRKRERPKPDCDC